MLNNIQQVLRLLMLTGKQRLRRGQHTAGGLLVLLWTDTGAHVQYLNCTVAAAGPCWDGINMEELQSVLTELKEAICSCAPSSPDPDPEDLCDFTDVHGSLHFLFSLQTKDAGCFSPEWQACVQDFLRTFSLANAAIRVHLKFKFNHHTIQQEFSGKIHSKVAQARQAPLVLDVTSDKHLDVCLRKEGWCQGGHPVRGTQLLLSIPPGVMDQGLYGDLSVQFVTLLTPCVLQYPNLETQLTQVQVLVYGPSNVPVMGPSAFLQRLPAHLDSRDVGLPGLQCPTLTDLPHSGGTVYRVELDNKEEPEKDLCFVPVQQSLSMFLFLRYSDPFASHLSDFIATEALIEHHLEDILSNNRRAVTAAVQAELKNTLKAQNRRKKDQEKLRSAAEVILASSIKIVSSSSNLGFRNACLNQMKVRDTHELSTSLCESLRRVTSWKFIPKGTCYSGAQTEELPETGEHSIVEM